MIHDAVRRPVSEYGSAEPGRDGAVEEEALPRRSIGGADGARAAHGPQQDYLAAGEVGGATIRRKGQRTGVPGTVIKAQTAGRNSEAAFVRHCAAKRGIRRGEHAASVARVERVGSELPRALARRELRDSECRQIDRHREPPPAGCRGATAPGAGISERTLDAPLELADGIAAAEPERDIMSVGRDRTARQIPVFVWAEAIPGRRSDRGGWLRIVVRGRRHRSRRQGWRQDGSGGG